MKYFLSCDWGTTSFRLRLVNSSAENILCEVTSVNGIAAIYALWKQQQVIERFEFFTNFLYLQILKLEEAFGKVLPAECIIISGMASSAIGMKELPYKKLPFKLHVNNLYVNVEEPKKEFPYKIIIVSGTCSEDDVMRGEETILAGCDVQKASSQLFILPGTHSKHITVDDGILTGIKTYMTGEFFHLLSTQSILSASVEKHDFSISSQNAFLKGIDAAVASSPLNNAFHIRTNELFNIMGKKDNYAYLSGLLIGEELKYLHSGNKEVNIVSSGSLAELYAVALTHKQIPFSLIDADKALIKAQTALFNHYQ